MSLLSRGLNILDENQDTDGGSPDEQIPTKPEADKPAGDDDSGRVEDTKPTKPAEPAPQAGRVEDSPKDEEIDEEVLQQASKKVEKKYRAIKREHAGLKGQYESIQKDAEEAPILRNQVAELKRENENLNLATKYGVGIDLLGGLSGDKEAKEKWLEKYLEPPQSDSPPAEKPTKKTEESEPKKAEPVDDKGKVEDKPGGIPDIDADRPKPKADPEVPDLSSMTNAQQREYWKNKL